MCTVSELFWPNMHAGYSYSFPFLKPASLVRTAENHVAPLYKHIFAVTAPTLAFIGLAWKSLRNVQFELQASSTILSPACTAMAITMLASL